MSVIYNNPGLKNLRTFLRKNPTEAEKKVWYYLRNKQHGNLRFFRQYGVGDYILDFYCPEKRLAIEIDGGQRNEETDKKRTEFLKNKNIKVIRFWNNEVLENIEGVISEIQTLVTLPALPLS